MDRSLPSLQAVAYRLKRIVEGVAIEAASKLIAELCFASPMLEHRREIHSLRMRLADSYDRISALEDELDNHKAMHELQHGTTVHLPLTAPTFPVKHRGLN